MTKTPNPIDVHVGSRVRMRRILLGMSQEKLGEALGLTFQQVQKYEKGANRIGASRMHQLMNTLNVPITFFYDGAPVGPGAATGVAEESSSYIVDFLATAESIALNTAFVRIQDRRVRKRIVDLVTSLADGSEPDNLAPKPRRKRSV